MGYRGDMSEVRARDLLLHRSLGAVALCLALGCAGDTSEETSPVGAGASNSGVLFDAGPAENPSAHDGGIAPAPDAAGAHQPGAASASGDGGLMAPSGSLDGASDGSSGTGRDAAATSPDARPPSDRDADATQALSDSGTDRDADTAEADGGPPSYQPCPSDGSPCLLLPFGDSITYGTGSSDKAGYRSALFERIVRGRQKAKFIGSQSDGPAQVAGTAFPRNHEGHPGWTIDPGYVSFGSGISTLIPMPAFNTLPHIVLLMIGTNDVSANKGTDSIADRLETLLDKIVRTAPNALIVVAQITPIGWNPPAASSYNAKLPKIIEARVAKGQHLKLVDMSKMPKSDLGGDNLHPNDKGYAYMADIWYTAIKDHLPTP